MAHTDHNGPDDSNAPRDEPRSVDEETPPVDQRIKNANEDAIGDTADNERLEDRGERQDAAARHRQDNDDIV